MPESKIKGAWDIIVDSIDGVIRHMSMEKYGHTVGNLTVADIKHHLVYKCGIDNLVSNALAGSAYKRHEKYRFSDEGKKIRADMEAEEIKAKEIKAEEAKAKYLFDWGEAIQQENAYEQVLNDNQRSTKA